MDMKDKNHITTLPKRGLKTRSHNMDMSKEDHITTLAKRGLKTRSHNMEMNDKNHLTTLPKRDLKRSPYSIDMNERDLEKLSKSELIKMLMKPKDQRRFVTMGIYSTMIHSRMKLHSQLHNESLQNASD